MSSNVFSQFPVSDRKEIQMEHPSGSFMPMPAMQTEATVNSLNGSVSHHFPVSKEEPMLNSPGFKTSTIMSSQIGLNAFSHINPGPSPIWMSSGLVHGDSVHSNLVREKTLLPVKRKVEVGTLLNNSSSKESMLPSKRPLLPGAYAGHPGLLQPSAPQRKTAMAQFKMGSSFLVPTSQSNKAVKNDSEAVRSKMKESLAAALALVKQHHIPDSQKDKINSVTSHNVPVDSEPNSATGVLVPGSDSVPEETFFPKEAAVSAEINDCRLPSSELPLNSGNGNGGQPFHEFQYSSILPDEDITFSDSFFVKDDLLQGNGLSWAFDFDVQMREGTDALNSEKLKSVEQEVHGHKDRGVVAILSPEKVASDIEAELFKLFGGVNKKYKEKGRSLLFNLKDRSNPELGERVMSGEILPSRLCSMSAEDLASKELSEWRMAKAEELAQMVVLPDTEVDISRLVRKTHKGEYQVEVERDDGISAEVSGGTSVLTQSRPKKEIERRSPSGNTEGASPKGEEHVTGQKGSSENQDFSGSLVIHTDGTDLMQGMMVDELKDAEFLPPIVSLDEFMESLNSEPPFESLSADTGQKRSIPLKESPEAVSLRSLDKDSVSPKNASSGKADSVKKPELVSPVNLSGSPSTQTSVPCSALGCENMWQGILQLSASASITVGCIFQSGEKTSMKKWPASLDIMGRVRLDSFEKFLRELPLSRTRAVMVLEFALRDQSSDTESTHITEAVDSYASDERLGYAEPTIGVELYLCPPTSRITDMLNKLVPKERSETYNSVDNKLIGVVVWRRAHKSNIKSPNSCSHNKHSSKKQPSAPPKRVQDLSNANVNVPTSAPRSVYDNIQLSTPEPRLEENDDVPPGFGPMAANDDDDLPEFNFSSHVTPSMPSGSSQTLSSHGVKPTHRPVDQIRELIHKYGQSGTAPSIRVPGIKQSNYDDDDIPEWQPEAPSMLPQQQYQTLISHQPLVLTTHPASSPNNPPARGAGPHSLGGRWMHPPGHQYDQRWKPS